MRCCCDGSLILQTEENRDRMWTFIFLCILGLNFCQAAGADYSTQMYYVKLTIEESAIKNITKILERFVSDSNLQVDNFKITTTCQNVSDHTVCTCEPNYRWSEKVCESNQKCCGNLSCTFPQNSASMCISDTTVTINGSITFTGFEQKNCLRENSSLEFQQCHTNLLEKMKEVYSTLRGFDTLTISKYRHGSIIADFGMTIADKVNPQDMTAKSQKLLNLSLSVSSLDLVTTGVVHLIMPTNPVPYNSGPKLTCTLQDNVTTQPALQLKRDGSVFDITNGTESVVTSDTRGAIVALQNVSELWAGEYTCVYCQKSAGLTISHKASAVMNVSLLPNIEITTEPGFPHCQTSSDSLMVIAKCEIGRSDENYNVTWTSQHIPDVIQRTISPSSSEETRVYEAEVIVGCNPPMSNYQLTCTFTNRRKQSRSASVGINIIYENETFCEAEGDWKDTKAGFTAVLKCKNEAGQRKRKCIQVDKKGTWEPEVSACVNQDVNDVLQKSIIVDIGLGSLDENAAQVFSRLENVTNNTQSINTFANINASVQVLFSLSQKDKLKPNETTFDDLLESSSNLLEKSLKKSWETEADKGNSSLAERYLSSVEQLIQVSNITGVVSKKTNIEVATRNCSQGSNCTNMAFNVTVVLQSSDPGRVKTAVFKDLENYLPNKDDEYKPNSHVVSTSTERKSDSVNVRIMFPLFKPRPPNVEMKCVSWDNNTRTWSSDGCVWEREHGSSNEEHCVCSHLSSFSILMSKHPLHISGLTEVTYVGLSISVMSLIMSLVIEMIVWSAIVKTNTLYLRHAAHVNISLCLLVADCCFLASSKPRNISRTWCKTFVVLKHFCYLSMFFWMLCLSSTLLHQAVFLFHTVSKKNYLRFSLVLGYVCPLLIVATTFLANNGAEGLYFSSETCWLVYSGLLKGSIHAFIIPVGIIVFVNVFSMLVVIMKLLDHPKNTEKSYEKEKKAAITAMRSVILLSPIFGVTWVFGFAVMALDLTSGNIAYAVNYVYTLLNAFQGLFILLTTCLGDKLARETLLNRLRRAAPAPTNETYTIKTDSTFK